MIAQDLPDSPSWSEINKHSIQLSFGHNMVSTVLFDTILNPSNELKKLFVNQDQTGFGAVVERHFKQLLSPHEAFFQVQS